MKVTSFFIVTEPEKMGFPYLESIEGALSFSDYALVIAGRREQSSEDSIHEKFGDRVRVINTEAWPMDWHYNHMRDHLQIGLEQSVGDWAVKVDADCVFNPSVGGGIRKILENNPDTHRVNFGRWNYYGKGRAKFNPNRVLYGVNKSLCREQGVKVHIDNSSGSNQPVFDGRIEEYDVYDKNLCPVNYDNTFMTKDQITEKWIRWGIAFNRARGREPKYEISERENAWRDYLKYMKVKSSKTANVSLLGSFHPDHIKERIKSEWCHF